MRTKLPVVKDFILESVEEYEGIPGQVTIRQASTGDEERLAALNAKTSQRFNDSEVGEVEITRYWNPEERKRFQAMFTLCNCNLETHEGKPYFKFANGRLNMSERDFQSAWASLPPEVSNEIYRDILDVNPQWDPLAGED